METKRTKTVAIEAILVKIFARLSLSTISRFRSVCKEWKSIIDSDFFKDLYRSLNSSSSSVSWSIMNIRNKTLEGMEIVGHHGCRRWGLSASLGSFMRYKSETEVKKINVLSYADGIVLLYTETMEGSPTYHVGNPLSQKWDRIPFPPHLTAFDVARLQVRSANFSDSGLVTKMENGFVLSYKVVWTLIPFFICTSLTFMIYSSETGEWKTEENVPCLRSIWAGISYSVPLNGVLHWLVASNYASDADYVVGYDFYNVGNECRIVPFPDVNYQGTRLFKRTFTTCAGFVVYCNVFSSDNESRTIKVWRLVSTENHPNSWKLSWKLKTNPIGFGVDYFPVVMHPFDCEIIYLWSRNNDGLVILNLRTHKFSLHKEEEERENKSMDGCIMSFSGCKEYMDLIYPGLVVNRPSDFHKLCFSHYVLPRWLHPLPSLSSS